MHLRDTADGPRLKIPGSLALDYAAMTAGTCKAVVDRVCSVYQPEPAHLDRWQSAKDRSQTALDSLLGR